MAGGDFLSSTITMAVDKLRSLVSSSSSSPTSSSSSSLPSNIEQEMSKLAETMRRIQAKLADAEEENHLKSHSEMYRLSEFKDVAYDAEDVVEEYEYEVLRSKLLHENNSRTQEDELAKKAAEIRKRFDEITKEWKLLNEMLPKNSGKRKRNPLSVDMNRETSSLVVESDVLGREEEKDKLVEWLLSENDSTNNRVSVIAVIGMGGLGKTTLAQLAYNDPRVKNYFNLRGWVCVSEIFHVVSLTEKILQSFTKMKVHEELDELQHALQENLQGKKFLLVLDDVWNDNFCLWEQLKKPLLWATAGKVIVTTRNHSVARIMQTTRDSLNLNVLPFDMCWSLFKKITLGGADKSFRLDIEDISRKIVGKCGGLPLAVKVLGGALRHQEDIESWEGILENEMWESEQTNKEVLPALQISYDCMPIQLKRCFRYLSLFPKDTSLRSEEIIRLWMSQGLIEDDRDKRAEDIGGNYIKKLAERSMIHLKLDVQFSMHDLVHDLAQNVARDEFLCVIDDKFDTKKLTKIRHLSVHIEPRNFTKEDPHLLKLLRTIQDLQQLKHMRTLFIGVPRSFFERPFITRQVKIFEVLDDLFQKLKCIRALRLSRIGITELPNSLCNLKLLRYLSIEYNEVESFPESICNLYNLRTLYLNSTKIRELPRQIGNLINLRHLLPSWDAALPSGIGNLTNLQRLARFNVSCEDKHCDIGELNSLMKLRGQISIYNVTSLNRFSNSEPPLKTKMYLNSVMLDWLEYVNPFQRSKHDAKKPEWHLEYLKAYPFQCSKQDKKKAEWQLEHLEPHVNLKKLRIHEYPGVRFVGWVGASSFTKLTSLSLSNCKNCTKLPPLGQLPSLKYLDIRRMNGIQHVGREFCSMLMASPFSSQNKIAFPSLKELEFDRMFNWEVWDGVDICDFPSLHSIEINECPKLTKLPQWPCMSSVKDMRLMCCGALEVPNLHSLTNLIISDGHGDYSTWSFNSALLESIHLSETQLPSLKTLEIRSSSDLWGVTGFKNFTSLNSLIIYDCPNLKFDELPATLKQLKLNNCPLFEKGFREQQGHMLNILTTEANDGIDDDDDDEEEEIEDRGVY